MSRTWYGRSPAGGRQIVDGADWASAEPVEVDLAEFEFSPGTLRFRKGRPYALKLTNTGSMTHRFMARGFFRAIAARSLMFSDGEASLPLLEAIAVASQETKTLYFVPVEPGDYYLSCDVPLHATFGMVGRILIE